MADGNHENQILVSLLNPHLLSKDQLQNILRERKICLDYLHTMSRDELLEIYNQFCMPLAQRQSKKGSSKKRSHDGHSQDAIASKLENTSITESHRFNAKKICRQNEIDNDRKRKAPQNDNQNGSTQSSQKKPKVYITFP